MAKIEKKIFSNGSVAFTLLPNILFKNHNHGGQSGKVEAAHLQEVHVPRRGPGPAAGHGRRPAEAAVQRPPAPAHRARPQEEAHGAAAPPPQGQEGGAGHGEAGGGQDAPARHDHRARDDRQHRRRPQRQGIHQRRDQAGDDGPLPGRVCHDLQAGQARSARYRSHPQLAVHPAQVICVLLSGENNTRALIRTGSVCAGEEMAEKASHGETVSGQRWRGLGIIWRG